MTEQEYKNTITQLVPAEGDVPQRAIDLIDAAVRDHPASASLWQKRGRMILLGSKDCPHTLADALASYHKGLDLDPGNADIVDDIAHFHDAVMDNELEARKWFAKSEELRRGQHVSGAHPLDTESTD